MQKLARCFFVIAACLAVLLLAACAAQPAATQREEVKVTRGDITSLVNADGELSLPLNQKLSFGTPGKIDQINVNEGDKVTKSQVLAKLDIASLQRQVQTADIAFKTAELNLKEAQASVLSAQADLEQATDSYRKISYPYSYSTFAFDVPAALDSINTAQRQLDEAQKAFTANMTNEDYNNAQQKLKDAQTNLTTARERLARGTGADIFAEGQLNTRDYWTLRTAQLAMDKANAGLQIAQNNVDKANLAVDKAKLDSADAQDILAKGSIIAPFDGVIADIPVKAGDSLTTVDYTKTVVQVIDPRHIELKVNVDEIDIPIVKAGQDATIRIDAMPETRLAGKVNFVSPVSTVEAGVVLYEVSVVFDTQEDIGLREGMSATADIVTSVKKNTLLLPTRAVSQDSSGQKTVNILVNGQLQPKTVTTGISDTRQTEILSGLNEGDTVIIERQPTV